LFLYVYVRKEALLSSQIEGTQSPLSDLLLFENREAPAVELGFSHLRPLFSEWYRTEKGTKFHKAKFTSLRM
jgi:hypothetical protein